jgi:hypothetical protein
MFVLSLLCLIGNSDQVVTKTLDVLFAPNFIKCEQQQFVDPRKDLSTIECSYSGNPQPRLTWLRRTDQKPITSDHGVTVETKNESHGKYRSVVTFDQNKLTAIPLPPVNNTAPAENYYQYLLNKGFLVKLTVNGNEKATRAIDIVRDASQIRLKASNSSTTATSLPSIVLLAFLFLRHILPR